jgi:CRISPR-associated protein Cas5h
LKGKVIVFDVWAPFAYFRKGFTTTTAITFPFIPRSAVEGLVGAILGLESNECPKELKNAGIAVGIIGRISKVPFSMMHTHVDAWKQFGTYLKTGHMRMEPEKFRARAKVEFLRDPKFRIYFSHDLQDDLKHKIQNHETVFTPYLGTSSMIANFAYVGEYPYSSMSPNESVHVSSVIPFTKRVPEIHLEDGVTYAIEQNIPIHITADRIVTGTFNAVYSPTGTRIKVSGVESQALETEGGRIYIIFLPTEVSP